MNKSGKLSEIWIKASIIGTIWAASEIVLGSFLHNLKVPFSGNVLTSIAIIILISVSYVWTEKGLFWRAGLICALMKTISPSAVIFGPMIAIFSEALLMELSVRVFGKTVLGFIFGAILAMSWNLFQKILNFIIFYGLNIVDIYKNLLIIAQKQLNIQFEIIWIPVIILLIIYSVLGIISGVIGIKVGRKIIKQPQEYQFQNKVNTNSENEKVKSNFNYSISWLIFDLILMICSLFILNIALIFWISIIPLVIFIWIFRYKRAMRQLLKPKFWISFVIITMLSAFVFTNFSSDIKNIEKAALIGIQMNFRAIIIIVGFSVLGTELYNPKIRQFFLKTYFKQLPLALELSFKSLPDMIANIPDFKIIIKNPVSVFYKIISQIDYRLNEIKNNYFQKIFIISGEIGQGKTSNIIKIIKTLKEKNVLVGGVFSPRIIENDVTIGYDIVDIKNNNQTVFLRIINNNNFDKIGRYSILPEGLEIGKKALISAQNTENKVVVIDEVGVLELENKGWASNIKDLIQTSNSHIIIGVRDSLAEQVIKKWELKNYFIYKIDKNNEETICELILKQLDL